MTESQNSDSPNQSNKFRLRLLAIVHWVVSMMHRSLHLLATAFRWLRNQISRLCQYWLGEEYTSLGFSDAHLQQIANKYYRRSRRYAAISILLLFSAIAIIAVGVSVFLFPTSLSDVSRAEEQIVEDEAKIDQTIEAYVKPAQQLNRAEELMWAVSPFFEVYKSVSVGGALPGVVSSRQPLKDVSALLTAMKDGRERFELRDLGTDYQYSNNRGNKWLSKETLERLNDMIDRNVVGSANRLSRIAEDISAGNPDGDWDLTLETAKRELAWTEKAFRIAQADVASVKAVAQIESDHAANRLKQIQALTREIARNEIRRGEAGVPSFLTGEFFSLLSIRIGIVVLLIFLSQVLLSTYRYTMSLSTYFRARADALQLMNMQGDAHLDVKKLGELLMRLSPDGLKVDRIASPDFTKFVSVK